MRAMKLLGRMMRQVTNAEIRKSLLQQYIYLLEDWIPKEAGTAIAMDGHYVYYVSGLHDIQLKEGQAVQTGSIADRVMATQQKVDLLMDSSLYGTPYYGLGYPINVNGKSAALVVILPPTYHVKRNEPLRLLTGKLAGDWFPIRVDHITHLESFQKKTFFYSEGEQYEVSNTLKELSVKLPTVFLRIHRSFIVNTSCIERISRDFSSNLQLTLNDGTVLPVSQTYVNDVKCELGF